MSPKQLLLLTAALTIGATAALAAANPGDEVIIIYNRRLPESKSLAEYYAQKRLVPTNQIFGFDLPTYEDISRTEYTDALEKPLAALLEKEKLWHIGSVIYPATNGQPSRVIWKPLTSKIRYAVLCYGVPLHITEDPNLIEPGLEKTRPEMRRNEAAVDSELACLPALDEKIRRDGPLRNPFYTTTNAAALHPTNNILMVARLDGPTAEIARSLVDKAIQAETDGLWGRAYFDERGLTDGAYMLGDEWLNAAAELTRITGYDTIVDTNADTVPAGFPMDHIAFYAGWYDENVSGPFTRPSVEFMPGAFAYHLHSFSAATVRSTSQHWVGPLLAKGATCTMGCVAEPYLTGTPDIGVFFGRFVYYGFTFGEAAYASQSSLSWQTTVVGDPLYRPFHKNPLLQQQQMEQSHSLLLEWAQLRVVNLSLAKRIPFGRCIEYLEQIPTTKHSAVLTGKLADLYAAQGKPASAIRSYLAALELSPSPQQRVKLRLALGEKLVEQDRAAEAAEDYKALLAENPDYPDRQSISNKLAALTAAPTPTDTNAPAK
jgi:uncharacterized protein (TIGR03790 family)